MEELIKGLRVGFVYCLQHVGDMPTEKCMQSTQLFADKVMPALRDMWPEYASDTRFWPIPLTVRAVPRPLAGEVCL